MPAFFRPCPANLTASASAVRPGDPRGMPISGLVQSVGRIGRLARRLLGKAMRGRCRLSRPQERRHGPRLLPALRSWHVEPEPCARCHQCQHRQRHHQRLQAHRNRLCLAAERQHRLSLSQRRRRAGSCSVRPGRRPRLRSRPYLRDGRIRRHRSGSRHRPPGARPLRDERCRRWQRCHRLWPRWPTVRDGLWHADAAWRLPRR